MLEINFAVIKMVSVMKHLGVLFLFKAIIPSYVTINYLSLALCSFGILIE